MTVTTLEIDLEQAERRDRERSITLTWDVGEAPPRDGDDEPRRARAVLCVAYDKAGANYLTGTISGSNRYVVSIRREYALEGGMVMTAMYNGVGILAIEAGARFSRKRMEEALERGIERLREYVEQLADPRVTRYFDPACDPKLGDS